MIDLEEITNFAPPENQPLLRKNATNYISQTCFFWMVSPVLDALCPINDLTRTDSFRLFFHALRSYANHKDADFLMD